MRRSFAFLSAVLLIGVLAAPASAAGDDGFTIEDARITESSGLAASHLHPGIYWTHNDSDDGPYIYAVDSRTGRTVATVTFRGVGAPRDVEAISIGPGNRIYLGDIGDNFGGRWPHVWIYTFAEPTVLEDQTVQATQYVVTYEDGPRDAESLVVHPGTGRVYIIDKKEDGGHLYEGPARLSSTGTNVFRPVAPVDLWATDAAFSPDGEQLAVRGYFGGIAYAWNDGRIKRQDRLSVPLQRQGESVTYTVDGSKLMYGSEGAGSRVQAGDLPGRQEDGHGGGSGASSGKGGARAGSAGEQVPDTDYKVGGLVIVVGLALVFGIKRLVRRTPRQ